MKRFGLIVLVFSALLLNHDLSAQVSESEKRSKPFSEDTLLSLIMDKIPEGWNVTIDSNRISFFYKDSVWMLKESRSAMKNLSKEQLTQRVMQKGEKTTSYLILGYEPKWDFKKIQDVKIKNSLHADEIKKLGDKYNIARFEDKTQSSRFNKVYRAGNADDQKTLDAYYMEKEKIEKKIRKLPDYNSLKYSLFLLEMKGYIDDETSIIPQDASLYLFTIKNLFDEICGR